MKHILITTALSILLSGCGGTALSPDMLNSLGIKENVAVVADNFTVRELALFRTQQVRLEQYATMYATQGVRVTFDVKEINGVIYIIPEINYKEKPDILPVSMQTTSHPLWGFATSVAKYGLIGYGVHELSGTIQAGYDAAQGATYNGPLINSQNTAGGDLSSSGEEFTLLQDSTLDNSIDNSM